MTAVGKDQVLVQSGNGFQVPGQRVPTDRTVSGCARTRAGDAFVSLSSVILIGLTSIAVSASANDQHYNPSAFECKRATNSRTVAAKAWLQQQAQNKTDKCQHNHIPAKARQAGRYHIRTSPAYEGARWPAGCLCCCRHKSGMKVWSKMFFGTECQVQICHHQAKSHTPRVRPRA